MVIEEYYTISELLNEVSNTKQEFKAKIGNGVESSNKREQEKAVRDITKDAEKMDNPRRNQKDKELPAVEPNDYNKTTMDVRFEADAPQSYKDRVRAQALGYPSVQNMNNNDYATYLDFDGNKDFYNDRKKMSDHRNEIEKQERESGLKARLKTATDYSNKSMFENKDYLPKKRLVFKNTMFLSEAQVIKAVPEDYRIDENRFYMQDKTGTDYLVECKADPFGYVHVEVVNRLNKVEVNEELDKMRRLADYRYSDDNKKVKKSNSVEEMSESIKNFRELLNN